MSKLVPKLRFKEFSGEWEEKELGQYVDILSGESPSKFEFAKHGIPYYKVEQLNDSTKYLKDSFYNIKETKKIAKKGSLVFPKRGASILLNKIRILLDNSFIDTNLMSLYTKNNLLNEFLYYYILQEDLSKIADTTSIPQINNKHIEPYTLYFPNPKEQQKIASCLSSLDSLIEAQNKKVEALKKHKKGLMQQLFPKEGEREPKLRFDGFSGEWEEKQLEEIAILTSSKRIYLSDYVDDGIPFYRGKEISELKNNMIIDDLLYIKKSKYIEIKNKYGVPLKNDILITAVGTLGNILRIKDNKAFYFKDGNLIWLKNIKIDSHFLEYLLSFEKKKILNSAIGSSQKALTMLSLNKIKFILPKKESEQQKIASCLSSLDSLIEAQNKKVEALKKHKKGLMQQMFVSGEAS